MLGLRQVSIGFGGPLVLDHVDLEVEEGERIALVGRNGAGKSTLLRVVQGDLEPDEGRVVRRSGLRISTLAQEVPGADVGTVLEVVRGGADATTARHEIDRAISRVALDPTADVASLSAGVRRRVHLARALAAQPDLLLLDEPTNHLDIDAITWLETFLLRRGTALLFVTHDRAFLERLATRIVELDRGALTTWPADYGRYREKKNENLAVEERERALFDKRLATEETWIRQGVRERRKRNQGRVGRLREMRAERADRRERPGTVQMEAQQADRSGRLVVRARNASYAYPGVLEDEPVIRDLSTEILRGDRVGIIGPNGSGKTTLIRLLLGELDPSAGEIRLGANLQVAYFDQLHAQLDERATAAENICDHGDFVTVAGRRRHVIGYLGDFLFTPAQTRSPITRLSGGERNRLLLARILARPSNVLVLDEPTNDLDLETLELLEDLLADYEGTILLVSHDRSFLDAVVTSTLVLEGGGRVGEYAGGYADQAERRARGAEGSSAVAAKARPKRGGKAPERLVPSLTKEERRELRALPQRIETLETEQSEIHARMADPAFYREPPEVIAAGKARLAEVERTLHEAFERWEALESKQGE